mmetsp:Transcript_6553/g.10330  ORF Transcript_6553/g.10330 Transcript_6553/m.10330 type:complete len:157 (+) Transcript_6553:375-845(+)
MLYSDDDPLKCYIKTIGGHFHPLRFYRFKFTPYAIMANHIFRLPSSAAGGERSFNVYGSTHTKKRNRLGAQKLDNLAIVKVNTKQLERNTHYYNVEARPKAVLELFFSNKLAAISDYSVLVSNPTGVGPICVDKDQIDGMGVVVADKEAANEDGNN